MTMTDGTVLEGTWRRAARAARAGPTYPDGSVYEGAFVAGQRQGQGRMRLANGQNYEGLWQAGRPAGGSAPLPETEATPAGARRPRRGGTEPNGSNG